MADKVWVGDIQEGVPLFRQKAEISPLDHGFLYGYGLFETILIENGIAFFLNEHLERLSKSSKTLQVLESFNNQAFSDLLRQYLNENKVRAGVCRLSITRGFPEKGLNPSFVLSYRQNTYTQEHYQVGFSGVLSPYRKNKKSPLVYHKTLNYLENILALQEARQQGFQEALFTNEHNHLTEGTTSNLFFIIKEKIYTPDLSCGLLEGITRKIICQHILHKGYDLSIGEYTIEDLHQADEAFLSNSVMGIMPLISVNNMIIGKGVPGCLTKKLWTDYQNLQKKYLSQGV